jgi:hypothetical protein
VTAVSRFLRSNGRTWLYDSLTVGFSIPGRELDQLSGVEPGHIADRLVGSTHIDAEAQIDLAIRVQLGRPTGRPFAL